MIVISNAGPIIALSQIGRLELLPSLFGRIYIPNAVEAELIKCKTEIQAADWLKTTPLSDASTVDVLRERLDAGESEAIVLAIRLNADLLLIDEARGRRVADAQGLNYTGTIGVVILAKKRGLLPAVKPVLHELRAVGLYMSEALYKSACQLAEET